MEAPFDRPMLPQTTTAKQTTYLVRSLVNGMYYYRNRIAGQTYRCATVSPLEAQGFERKEDAVAFARQIEQDKKQNLCIGKPPYTRIEVRTDKIEISAELDDSSSSEI